MPRSIPQQIAKQRKEWWRAYVIWVSIHWLLTGVATLAACLAAAFTSQAKILGTIAACCSALIGAANPYKRADGFFRAYRRLNNACIAFECDEKLSMEELLAIHNDGEMIIESSES